jgi:hypothetical protein
LDFHRNDGTRCQERFSASFTFYRLGNKDSPARENQKLTAAHILVTSGLGMHARHEMQSEYPMPDLSDLDSLKKQLLVVLIGFGDKGLSRKVGLHRRNFIRLVDKALYEYEEAREDLVAEIEEEKNVTASTGGRIIYTFGFIDHLENCINATKRLLQTVERLKSEKTYTILSRHTRRLIEGIGKDVANLRHVIEHIDEKIHNDEIEEEEPVMLSLSRERDKVSVAGYHLELSQLALVLRKLHGIGVSLIDLSPKSS